MKNKPIIITMLGSFLLSVVAVSNVAAEEMTWVNTYEFIAGQNVKLSHDSPEYPGSIIVQPINDNDNTAVNGGDLIPEEIIEGGDDPVPSEIIKRFKIKEEYELTSISICLRDYVDAPMFATRIFRLGVPTDVGTVGMDELLFESDPVTAEAECTVIPVDEAISSTGETLLLSIAFDSALSLPAVISAVGLGQTSAYFMIDGCNTNVPDIYFDGKFLSERIDECAVEANNHGKFVSCVSKAANVLKKEVIISGKDKGRITSCAAKSSLPN